LWPNQSNRRGSFFSSKDEAGVHSEQKALTDVIFDQGLLFITMAKKLGDFLPKLVDFPPIVLNSVLVEIMQ
jgi:hypothetical protein